MPFDGTNLTPLQQALMEARKLIEDGWCQNHLSLIDKHGKARFCLTGAIRKVVYGTPFGPLGFPLNPLEEHMRQAISAHAISARAVSIEDWNDTKSRRKGQVLEAFDRAITGVEQDERLKAQRAPAGGW